MIEIRVGEWPSRWEGQQGTYRVAAIRNRTTQAVKITAYLCCPNCETVACLDSHEIAEDGTVTPSVVCPHQPECTFHEMVKLVEWKAEFRRKHIDLLLGQPEEARP